MDPHGAQDYIAAPGWSLLLGTAGKAFVFAAAALFILCAALPFFNKDRISRWCFGLGCASVFAAFACLATLFVTDQFQYEYIAAHSWHDMGAKYKLAAVWAGQQGSFLLWAVTSGIFGILAFRGAGPFQRWFTFAYSVFLASLCGILSYETPFNIIEGARLGNIVRIPVDGNGLNASLQNYWVVIHPPTIFLGFGSLAVMFAFAFSAMVTGQLGDWAARVRPWALVSMAILGLGLCMGGFWAYETQGWGGFWAWDPVENVSFVPWIFTAAFIHGIIVQTTRSRWHGTNLLLGGLPFLMFAYGTFLTRSGFLNEFSKHSFAQMNRTALWILLSFLVVSLATFLALYFKKGIRLGRESDLKAEPVGFNRESAYQSGVLLLCGLAATIGIGMSIPFFMGLMNKSAKVVQEPLYHNVVVWFFMPIMVLMAAGPFLTWRKMPKVQFWNRFMTVLGITFFVTGIAGLMFKFSDWSQHADLLAKIDFPLGLQVNRFGWVMALLLVCSMAAVGNIWRIVETFKRSKMGIGGFVSHLGLSMALAGLILSRGLEREAQMNVADGIPGQGLGYLISLKKQERGPNTPPTEFTSDPQTDRENKVLFDVTSMTDKSQTTFEARPGFFFVPGNDGKPGEFTWPHIEHTLTHDVYLNLGPPQYTLWEEPITLKPGETHREVFANDKEASGEAPSLSITYEKFVMHGEPGQPGTKFGAKLKIVEGGKEYYCEPTLDTSMNPELVPATENFYAYFDRMDVASKAIALQLPFRKIIYPIQLFYKPMTILVWTGTGILTLGGLLSAFYRRKPRPRQDSESEVAGENVEQVNDAPVAIAQS